MAGKESLKQGGDDFGFEQEKKHPKRVILEIGGGFNPIPILGKRKIQEDELYINLDTDTNSLKRGENIIARSLHEGQYKAVAGHGERIPLSDYSVSEMLINNLFSLKSESEIQNILRECRRILKEDGAIIIQETYTPSPRSTRMVALLKEHGFVIDDFAQHGDENWESARRIFNDIKSDISTKGLSYIIKAKIRHNAR